MTSGHTLVRIAFALALSAALVWAVLNREMFDAAAIEGWVKGLGGIEHLEVNPATRHQPLVRTTPPLPVIDCVTVMYTWSMSGRSSRSTLMQMKVSFISFATSSSSKLSCSITWHQWHVE